MKISLVPLGVLAFLHYTSALTGCKKSIEDGIRAFWKTNGTPKFRDCGLMRFAYATKDLTPDNVKCVLATHDYKNNVAPATFYYKDGTKKPVEYKFTAEEGVLHLTAGDKKYLEYVILDHYDFIALYKCIPNEPATGADTAIIAESVGASGKDTVKDIVTAITQLTAMGITGLTPVGSCPENEKKP